MWAPEVREDWSKTASCGRGRTPALTRSWQLWLPRENLHKSNQPTLQHGLGRGSQALTPNWGAMNCWQLLGEGELVPFKCGVLGWVAVSSGWPHTHEIVGSINWTLGFFLNRGHEVWRVRRVRKIWEELGEVGVGDMIEIQCRKFSKN